MSFPIAEMITQDLVKTLTAVKLGGGYNTSLKVERFKRGGKNTKDHLTAILSFYDDVPVPDEDSAELFTSYVRPYWLMVYLMQPESSNASYDQLLDVVKADVEKALMADYTRGKYALNTKILQPQRFDPEDDMTGILINFDVEYRTAINDPYRVAPGAQIGAPNQ